ncbi:MAG: zinc ribbon domain-containing protein [Candidatus Gastranaerophilales bacterium]|nr:zinc ribbon domain-containing protein [Candidatus Gastranaerophilales bacterium]
MRCSKCTKLIDKNAFYCKSCGNLIKVECPRCKTINKKSICSKCGLQLIIKCNKCEQINSINFSHCIKCNTNLSELLKTTLQELVIVLIKISNLNEIKQVLETDDLFNPFKSGIYDLIQAEIKNINASCEEIQKGVIVVKIENQPSFLDSCNTAVNLAEKLALVLNKVNYKLKNSQNISMKINIGISSCKTFERRFSSRPEIAICTREDIDVIVNPAIYHQTKDSFHFKQVVTLFVNNQILQYYKLINKFNKKENDSDSKTVEENSEVQNPDFDKNEVKIDFIDKKRQLAFLPQSKLQLFIKNLIKDEAPKSNFINVIGETNTGKLNNLSVAELKLKLPLHKWFEICCTENNKLYPFGLMRYILRSYFCLDDIVVDKNQEKYFVHNKLSELIGSDSTELENLILIQDNNQRNPEEITNKLFDQINRFFKEITNHKQFIFLIEDFENIDKGSLECFSFLLENGISRRNLTFLVSTTPDFKLSSYIFKLNNYENYHEVILQPDSASEIEKKIKSKAKTTTNSFLLKKIQENSNGSDFYINQALHYLTENNAIKSESNKIITIPATIDEIIDARLKLLLENPELSDIYIKLILFGHKIPLENVMKFNGTTNKINLLVHMDLLEYINNKPVKLKNYNLFKKHLLNLIKKSKLQSISSELSSALGYNIESLDPNAAECLELANQKKDASKIWKQLAHINLLLGDISAFTNCSTRFLNLIESFVSDKQTDSVKEIKMEIYEQIGKLSYESYPEIAIPYLKEVINNAEKTNNDEKVIKLSSFIVNSCNLTGNYQDSLDFIGKILSKAPKGSFNIKSKDFNPKFYLLNFIKIQSLFNLGNLEDCIILAEEILPVLKLLKDNKDIDDIFSVKSIENMIKDTEFLLIKAKILQLSPDTGDYINKLYLAYPEDSEVTHLLQLFNKVISGSSPEINKKIEILMQNENLSYENKLLCSIVSILHNIQHEEWYYTANLAYSTRLIASESRDYQILYFLDLIIGFAYQKINNLKKAREIYNDVLKISAEKKILNIMLMSWYLIADLELIEDKPDVAFEIVNKANVVLEQNRKISKIFSIYYISLFARIFKAQGEFEKAKKCIEQILNLTTKHELIYNQVIFENFLAEILLNLLENAKNEQNETLINKYSDNINRITIEIENLTQKLNNPVISTKMENPLTLY